MSGVIAGIMIDECILPNDLCIVIDSYLRVSDGDRIKYMLANRDEPAVFVCVAGVVDDLDEIFELKYDCMSDTWSQMKLADRIISLDRRAFQASLQLPHLGKMKTEYTLFALLRDMQERGPAYSSSVFKWRDLFNSSLYANLSDKIRALWEPAGKELCTMQEQDTRMSEVQSQHGEDYFVRMRANIACMIASAIIAMSKMNDS